MLVTTVSRRSQQQIHWYNYFSNFSKPVLHVGPILCLSLSCRWHAPLESSLSSVCACAWASRVADQTRSKKYVGVTELLWSMMMRINVRFWLFSFCTVKSFPVCQLLQMKLKIMESERKCGCIIVIANVGVLFTITILPYSESWWWFASWKQASDQEWNCERSRFMTTCSTQGARRLS